MNQPQAMTYPGATWATTTPSSEGLSESALAAASDEIFTIDDRYGVLFIANGRIVYERYKGDADDAHTIYSVTKGLGATLIGIAQTKGLLHVDDKISDWLPVHHPDIAEDATIAHVLNMTAGHAPPGSVWRYNSNYLLNSLTGILWLASGLTPVDFYNRYLKAPLQLGFDWPSNPKGWIQIGSQGPLPVIEATHRDIARVGHLWLNRGMWNGEQLIDPTFIDAALSPLVPDVNGAYGFLWWLNHESGNWRSTGGNTGSGRWFPNAAANVFMALGAFGKVMIVCPDHNLIMVSMGNTPQEQSGNYLERMMTAVSSVLPG